MTVDHQVRPAEARFAGALPVDEESRFPLIERVNLKAAEPPVVLSPDQRDVINESLSIAKSGAHLDDEGAGGSTSLLMYGPPGTGKMWTGFLNPLTFNERDVDLLVDLSEGCSGSDIHEVCRRLHRRRITTQHAPELKDAFQALQNIGIGEGETRRFISAFKNQDADTVAKGLRARNVKLYGHAALAAETCPIVGAGKLSELVVEATPEGLVRLTKIIEQNDTEYPKPHRYDRASHQG